MNILYHKKQLRTAVFLFGFQWSLFIWAEDIKIPLIENYDIKIEANKFASDAQQFINENPNSKFIPRLWYDLHLAGITSSNGKLIKLSKARLLMEAYPSVYSTHFLSSINDAEQMQTLIKEINDVIDNSDQAKARRLCELTRYGIQKFNAEIMKGDIKFPVIIYAHTKLANDDELNDFAKNIILQQLEKNGEYKEEVDVLLSDKTPFQKYLNWHQVNTKLGDFMMNLYYDYLSEAEKSKPDIIISRLNSYYDKKEFIQLLEKLEDLPEDKKNRVNLLTIKGMALFALKKDHEAKVVMDKAAQIALNKNQKDSILRYKNQIENFEKNKNSYSNIIPEFANTFLGGELMLEVDVVIQEMNNSQIGGAYLAMDLSSNSIEIQIREGEELKFAYRVKNGDTSIYIHGDENIIEYDGIVMYPLPSISLSKNLDGGFNFAMGFNLTSDISQLSLNASRLFGSPYLSSAYGFGQYFDYAIRKTSIFMSSPINQNDIIKLQMGSLDWANLEESKITISLDKEYAITEVESSDVINFRRVYLGANSGYNFSPPHWPEKPVERKGEFDQTIFFDLFGRIMKIASSITPK